MSRIDDQVHPAGLHGINDVGTPLGGLKYKLGRNPSGGQGPLGAPCGDELEPDLVELVGDLYGQGLVGVLDAHKGSAARRQAAYSGDLGLGEGPFEGGVDAHHLAGGFHLRAEDGIDPRELDKGKYSLLDGVMAWGGDPLQPQFFQRGARH